MSSKTFRSAFIATTISLCIGIGLLAILTYTQGQRIRHVSIDAKKATASPRNLVRFSMSQPVQSVSKEQISISPDVPFAVLAQGETIALQLEGRLKYNTKYEVTLSKVRSPNGRESKNLTYSFSTPPATKYYIQHNYESESEAMFNASKAKDKIIKKAPDTDKEQEVFTASSIQDICKAGNSLIVNTIEEKEYRLYAVDTITFKQRQLPLPETGGRVSMLDCSPDDTTYGYAYSSDPKSDGTYRESIFANSANSQNQPREIKGINNETVGVSEWRFAPDGTSLLANSYNNGVMLIDLRKKNEVKPLGKFYTVGSFASDGRSVIAGDERGLFLFNVQTLEKKLISAQQKEEDPASAFALQSGEGRVERIMRGMFDTFQLQNKDGVRLLYTTNAGETVIDYSVTLNDQYLVITTSDDPVLEYDPYTEKLVRKQLTTTIIDLASLEKVDKINGENVIWSY